MIELVRLKEVAGATLGILIVNDWPSLSTLELPWKDNQRSVSCIPKGEYRADLHFSDKFGKTYWVTNVPGRSEILFHIGNTPDDTRGCILPGMHFKRFGDVAGVGSSGKAMEKFLQLMKDEPSVKLIVR